MTACVKYPHAKCGRNSCSDSKRYVWSWANSGLLEFFREKVYVNDVTSFPTFKGSKSFPTKLGIIEIHLGGVENRKNMYL